MVYYRFVEWICGWVCLESIRISDVIVISFYVSRNVVIEFVVGINSIVVMNSGIIVIGI